MAIEHRLISMQFEGGIAHAYCMCDPTNANGLHYARNMLVDQAEKHAYGGIFVPLVLETKLNVRGTKKVRKFLGKMNLEVAKALEEAKDYHLSVWLTPSSHPDTDWLWRLH